jgi:hypothetical protein
MATGLRERQSRKELPTTSELLETNEKTSRHLRRDRAEGYQRRFLTVKGY